MGVTYKICVLHSQRVRSRTSLGRAIAALRLCRLAKKSPTLVPERGVQLIRAEVAKEP